MADTAKTTTAAAGTAAARARTRRNGLLAGLIITGLIFGLSYACTPGSDERSRAVTSEEIVPWPFTVTSGTLRCRPGDKVTFEAAGVEYALNGTAQADYPKPTAIWADDPTLGHGLKKNISAAIAAGRALC